MTDETAVGTVSINVTNMTGVVVSTLIGTNSGANRYSAIFNTSTSTSPGNYSFKILANDSSNNLNYSVNSTFVISDVTKPRVENLSSTPISGNLTNTFNVSGTVSDNFLLDTVMVNVTNSTGALMASLLGTDSGSTRYSVRFNTSLSTAPGNYTYRVIANDSSANVNLSATSTFVVSDATPPNVSGLASNIVIGNQSLVFDLTANVTDTHLKLSS